MGPICERSTPFGAPMPGTDDVEGSLNLTILERVLIDGRYMSDSSMFSQPYLCILGEDG